MNIESFKSISCINGHLFIRSFTGWLPFKQMLLNECSLTNSLSETTLICMTVMTHRAWLSVVRGRRGIRGLYCSAVVSCFGCWVTATLPVWAWHLVTYAVSEYLPYRGPYFGWTLELGLQRHTFPALHNHTQAHIRETHSGSSIITILKSSLCQFHAKNWPRHIAIGCQTMYWEGIVGEGDSWHNRQGQPQQCRGGQPHVTWPWHSRSHPSNVEGQYPRSTLDSTLVISD